MEDSFSSFITLHWGDGLGDGLLRNSQRFESRPRAHPLPEQDTTISYKKWQLSGAMEEGQRRFGSQA
eukprot:3529644-Prymnesium_polylepis.1